MGLIDNKINHSEEKFNKSKTIMNAHILMSRYFIKYKYKDDFKCLNKSIATLKEIIKNGVFEDKTYLFLSYLYVENKDYEIASAYLKKYEEHRKFYKNNDVNSYIIYLYAKYMCLKFGKKIFQQRLAFKKLIKFTKQYPLAQMLIGNIYINNKKYEEAYEYLSLAYINGNNSTLLFMSLYDYYLIKDNNNDASELLFKVVTWAIRNGLDVHNIFNSQIENIQINSKANLKMAKNIYYKFDNDNLLQQIVTTMCLDDEYDLSEEAFKLYQVCERKQIEVPRLEEAIAKCCIKYEYENISRYIMGKYIDEYKVISNEKAYIFHLILSYDKFDDYVDKYKNEIIEFYIEALEKNNFNRMFYSGYKYLLLNADLNLSNELIEKLENVLLEKLFIYEITTSDNNENKIYIKDKYLSEYIEGRFENNVCNINIFDPEFKYFTFYEEGKNAVNSNLKIRKFLSGSTKTLINYFIDKGYKDDYLLLGKCIYDIYSINDENIDYFNEVMDLSIISEYTKKEFSSYLGEYFAKQKDYVSAISYYENLNLILDNVIVVGCIKTYIKNNEIEKAINVLMQNYTFINSDDLLSIVGKLYIYEDYHKQLSVILLRLSNRIKNNDKYIKILYENIDNDLSLLLKLSNDFDNHNLSNKILSLSMSKRIYNKETERNFLRSYKYDKSEKIINDYIYYICYEVIRNNTVVSDDILKILRVTYDDTSDVDILACILKGYSKNKTYILNEVDFINDALETMAINNILLPEFEKLLSKKIKNDFVSKYYSIQYKGNKKNDVYVYIKYNDEEYKKIKMDYFKFSMFTYKIPVFYKDTIRYYFEEILESGSIKTEEFKYKNNKIQIVQSNDEFFKLNNALIQEDMSRMKDVEESLKIITNNEEQFIGLMI